MIEPVRRLLIAVALVGCGDEFPHAPKPIAWTAARRVPRQAWLYLNKPSMGDREYRVELSVEVPEQAGNEGTSGGLVTFTMPGLRLDLMAIDPRLPLDQGIVAAGVDPAGLTDRNEWADGWVIAWQGGRRVRAQTNVATGAVVCDASATEPDEWREDYSNLLVAMCTSVKTKAQFPSPKPQRSTMPELSLPPELRR